METAVVIALLVLAVAWYNQFQETGDARDAKSASDLQLDAAQDDLRFWEINNDPVALREELTQLQSLEQDSLALPTRATASSFGDELLIYANEQELRLPVFGQAGSVASVGDQEFQAIHYSIRALGSADALVGVLKLLQEFPTAAVQTLEFVRPPEQLESWEMSLELDVFFGPGGI